MINEKAREEEARGEEKEIEDELGKENKQKKQKKKNRTEGWLQKTEKVNCEVKQLHKGRGK